MKICRKFLLRGNNEILRKNTYRVLLHYLAAQPRNEKIEEWVKSAANFCPYIVNTNIELKYHKFSGKLIAIKKGNLGSCLLKMVWI